MCSGGTCAAACLIAGVLHADGNPDPEDPCQRCDVRADTAAWTVDADGTACPDDGNPCTLDRCVSGTCGHEAAGAGTPCGELGACDGAGTCSARCRIQGVGVADGAPNPANACQRCDTTRSLTTWSPGPAGTACGGGGRICDGAGRCAAGCVILGTFHDDGAPNPETPCQVCRAKSATAAWSAAANGARCGADLCGDWSDCAFPDACAGDGEQTRGCAPLVCAAGTCVSERAHLQTRACSRGTQDGAACDDGNACTADDRCGGGACVGQAYACPDNPCQKSVACDGQGGCLGTPKRDGTHCDDGDPCTRDDVCTDGVCGGRAYSCPAPTECEVAVTCDGKGKCHHLRAPAGTACDDGDPCTEGDRCDHGRCAGEAYRCPDARPGTCVQAIACDGGGGCVSAPAPDGAPCAPATCSDGACSAGECVACAAAGAPGACCSSVTGTCTNPVAGICF